MGGLLAELDSDPHPVLARLREQSPVAWLPELSGWLVTSHAAAVEALLDAAAFTVDDPRFTTARVTGPSMLSLDGPQHARHRGPFAQAFRAGEVQGRLAGLIRAEAARLVATIRPAGAAELRRSVAGPLAAAVMAHSLGLAAIGVPPGTVLAWYRDIVTAVSELPAALPAGTAPGVPVASFEALAAALREVLASGRAPLPGADAGLADGEVISNAAVALFGGIETMEGMICNALLWLLGTPEVLGLVRSGLDLVPVTVEESLRLEPAAAVVDRYATCDVTLAGAAIRRGDFVRVSISGANRDPAVFADPDRYDIRRPGIARHLAFARGPHFCIGAHLARLEAVTAVTELVTGLPGLHLDPGHPPQVRGLVFRKPDELRVRWRA